jgi:hypothetical protein
MTPFQRAGAMRLQVHRRLEQSFLQPNGLIGWKDCRQREKTHE